MLWAYVGSHNLSNPAWGSRNGEKGPAGVKLAIQSWELGVFFNADLLSAHMDMSSRRTPFQIGFNPPLYSWIPPTGLSLESQRKTVRLTTAAQYLRQAAVSSSSKTAESSTIDVVMPFPFDVPPAPYNADDPADIASVHGVNRCIHGLKSLTRFTAKRDGYYCDMCKNREDRFLAGTELWGCIQCKFIPGCRFNLCSKCHQRRKDTGDDSLLNC